MLSYRAANVRDREKWAAILDEGFVFTMPITPYRWLMIRMDVAVEKPLLFQVFFLSI